MKVISLVVGLTVGVLLMVGLVSPIVADGQTTAGDVIKKSNADLLTYNEFGQYWNEDLVFSAVSPSDATTAGDTTFSANGEVVNMRGPTYNTHMIMTSDNFSMNAGTSGSTNYAYSFIYVKDGVYNSVVVGIGKSTTITYDHSAQTINIVSDENNINETIPASYCFSISNKQDYEYINNINSFPDLFITDKEINNKTGGIIDQYSASFTVGETTFTATIISDIGGTRAYYDHTVYAGELKVELVFDGLHIADGTTDIYTGGTPKFIVTTAGGEEITPNEVSPSRSYIIAEVSGHKDSGANYALLGAIPIVAFIALIAFAAFAVRGRMND